MTQVSVIIPAYNAAPYLAEAIDSVLAQDDVHTEVIVVDDGSTDETAEVLRFFEGRIRVIKQRNTGVSSARNAGAAAASHEILAFLDADDVWLPDKLHRQCTLLAAGYDAVGCGIFVTDAALQVTAVLEAPVCSLSELVRNKSNAGLVGSSTVTRRTLFDRIGGFCDRLSNGEDWDLAVRLLETGRVTSVRQPLVYYRQHGAGLHHNVHGMERDMTLAYARLRARLPAAISTLDIEHGQAQLWRILAGSYWHQGAVLDAIRCGLCNVIAQPSGAAGLAGHAWRALRRR